jgi:hypothetical protein
MTVFVQFLFDRQFARSVKLFTVIANSQSYPMASLIYLTLLNTSHINFDVKGQGQFNIV